MEGIEEPPVSQAAVAHADQSVDAAQAPAAEASCCLRWFVAAPDGDEEMQPGPVGQLIFDAEKLLSAKMTLCWISRSRMNAATAQEPMLRPWETSAQMGSIFSTS